MATVTFDVYVVAICGIVSFDSATTFRTSPFFLVAAAYNVVFDVDVVSTTANLFLFYLLFVFLALVTADLDAYFYFLADVLTSDIQPIMLQSAHTNNAVQSILSTIVGFSTSRSSC